MRQRTERVQVRFPDRIKQEIERLAMEQQVTQGEIVVQLVERALSIDSQEQQRQIIVLHETVSNLIERIQALENKEEQDA